MPAARFYADMHVPFAVVRTLRDAGLDVLTTQQADMETAADEAQLEFARADGRIMLTQDKDFLRLHALGQPHRGIVYLRQRRRGIGEMARAIIELAELAPEKLSGELFFR